MKRIGDLELEQDIEYQKHAWRFERIGWVAMALIVLLGLLGGFGTGPISGATAGDPDGPLAVEYERFVRHTGEASLSIQVAADQVVDGMVEIWIDATYLEGFELQQISVEPEEVRLDGERVIYAFAAEDPQSSLTLTFSIQPQEIGRYAGEVGIVDGSQVTFRQFSYP